MYLFFIGGGGGDDFSNLFLKSKLHFMFSSCVFRAYFVRILYAHVRARFVRVRARMRTHDRAYRARTKYAQNTHEIRTIRTKYARSCVSCAYKIRTKYARYARNTHGSCVSCAYEIRTIRTIRTRTCAHAYAYSIFGLSRVGRTPLNFYKFGNFDSAESKFQNL